MRSARSPSSDSAGCSPPDPLPRQSEGAEQDRPIRAELLPGRSAMHENLVITGSHDVTLDLLADHMKRAADWIRVSSSNVGSLGGLLALAAGRCHVGGTHLLDPATGEYNRTYLQQHLADTPARLVTLALRHQGLIVKKGNPKSIRSFADLIRDDVRMINRQAGSGTRVLLDYYLDQESVDRHRLNG